MPPQDQSCVQAKVTDLSDLHMNLANELARLHQATLEMQTAVSADLSRTDNQCEALLSLQALDAHAQILRDLSCLLKMMGQKTKHVTFDLNAFREAKILPSTAAAVFGPDAQTSRARQQPGDVTMF